MGLPALRAGLLAAAAALVLASVCGPAGAEQTGGGGVVVSLNGSIAPKRLPRHRPVPVSVTLAGAVWAAAGGTVPRLGSIELAFGARDGLDTVGLTRCPRARLRDATAQQALARCRAALVGRGTITAEVPLNPEEPLLARAGVLAFNGTSGGYPAIWLHAYTAFPPVSFVLPFFLRQADAGTYGLLLRSPVGRALGPWPRLRSFDLTLGRRYRAGGTVRSYLSADCPLPPRLHIGFFPLARATYRFSPGPTHVTTHLSACRAKD